MVCGLLQYSVAQWVPSVAAGAKQKWCEAIKFHSILSLGGVSCFTVFCPPVVFLCGSETNVFHNVLPTSGAFLFVVLAGNFANSV